MNTDETSFFAGNPRRRETRVYAGEPPTAPPSVSHTYSRKERVAIGVIQRLMAGLAVAAFCYDHWSNWWTAWYFRNKYDPPLSLGPLYFLVNATPSDDWIGYTLLAVVAMCFVAFVVWPRRWTALPAWLIALVWVVVGGVDRQPGGSYEFRSAESIAELLGPALVVGGGGLLLLRFLMQQEPATKKAPAAIHPSQSTLKRSS
jgi:hypothetical protein